jgi:hypothetical protein
VPAVSAHSTTTHQTNELNGQGVKILAMCAGTAKRRSFAFALIFFFFCIKAKEGDKKTIVLNFLLLFFHAKK